VAWRGGRGVELCGSSPGSKPVSAQEVWPTTLLHATHPGWTAAPPLPQLGSISTELQMPQGVVPTGPLRTRAGQQRHHGREERAADGAQVAAVPREGAAAEAQDLGRPEIRGGRGTRNPQPSGLRRGLHRVPWLHHRAMVTSNPLRGPGRLTSAPTAWTAPCAAAWRPRWPRPRAWSAPTRPAAARPAPPLPREGGRAKAREDMASGHGIPGYNGQAGTSPAAARATATRSQDTDGDAPALSPSPRGAPPAYLHRALQCITWYHGIHTNYW
jgi:hypothetical protein